MDSPNATRRTRSAGLAHALALGAVSYVFSESMFWAHWQHYDTPAGVLLTWLVYTAVAYLAYAVSRRSAVTDLAGLFLVGAIYGWLVEGAIAGTVFTSPVGFAWTALAWHAPLTVWVGWHLLPHALRHGSRRVGIVAVTALGLGLGLWSTGFVHEPDGDGVPSVGAFAVYVTVLTVVLWVAYIVIDRHAPRDGDPLPSRLAVIVAAALVAGWFVLAVVVALPWAALVLPGLLALPLAALRAGVRRRASGPQLMTGPLRPLSGRDCLPMIALPVVAVATFVTLEPVAGTVPVLIAYLVSVPGSIAAFGVSFWSKWRTLPAATSSDIAPTVSSIGTSGSTRCR